jgi:hypothetical protein
MVVQPTSCVAIFLLVLYIVQKMLLSWFHALGAMIEIKWENLIVGRESRKK